MREFEIMGEPKPSINAMLEEVRKALCANEEIRVYFLFNEDIFKMFRSRLRSSLRGVAVVHTSPKKFVVSNRFYGLDFYPDNSLRNKKICEELNRFKQF